MKSEEAIKIIKSCNMCDFPSDYTICEIQQALEMAINALSEHLDTEKNDNSAKINDKMQNSAIKVDLISREEVLSIIDEEKWEYIKYVTEDIGGNVDTHIRCYTENIRDRLFDLPTHSANLVKESGVLVKDLVKDGDLISRYFMKELGATCIAKRSETVELVAISSIDNLPSAEKTAEWIIKHKITNSGSYWEIKCSNCGIESDSIYRYCPYCGAKMKKKEEEGE